MAMVVTVAFCVKTKNTEIRITQNKQSLIHNPTGVTRLGETHTTLMPDREHRQAQCLSNLN